MGTRPCQAGGHPQHAGVQPYDLVREDHRLELAKRLHRSPPAEGIRVWLKYGLESTAPDLGLGLGLGLGKGEGGRVGLILGLNLGAGVSVRLGVSVGEGEGVGVGVRLPDPGASAVPRWYLCGGAPVGAIQIVQMPQDDGQV